MLRNYIAKFFFEAWSWLRRHSVFSNTANPVRSRLRSSAATRVLNFINPLNIYKPHPVEEAIAASNGTKKNLVIMGTHPKSKQNFDWSRMDCEIWLFNEAASAKNEKGELKYPKCDAVIQMHHEAVWKNPKNRSDNEHYNWLSSGKTPPIYMQEVYSDVPKSVRYPIEDVLSLVKNVRMVFDGEEKQFRYFTSSPDYALALAARMCKYKKRYERIEVWGIELETESEYVYQRMGFGFWIGVLAGLGVPVVLHSGMFNEPMYGYEGDLAISSKDIEKRIADLTAELGNDREQYAKEAKAFLEGLSKLAGEDVGEEIQRELNELTKRNERAGILNGKIKESDRYLEKARAMEDAAGMAVFAPGEFDGTRIGYNKQYVEARLEASNLNGLITMQSRKLWDLEKGSEKRQKALDELGHMVAELMNKNMILFHIIGGMQENQYYLDSYKQSLRLAGGK